ncbi:ester cyclase [Jannaschia sp. Os4]|uniref:nuclear transport factor 2 family protein n=1 Tax=Jannaschia sp. Os4 TaxID=2807617 RepID=UPI00193ABC39|nr:ester cyclase [Jannaschia sp. Os4]MBM2577078.1 ester cyclase [Jannaschia sp. Os4]
MDRTDEAAAASDGPPAVTDAAAAKTLLERLARGDLSVLAPGYAAEASAPWGTLSGMGAAGVWHGLRRALPDGERRDDILLEGANAPDARVDGPRAPRVVAALGRYVGTFREPLAGIPPTRGVVELTYGEAHAFERGRLVRSWLVWDVAGLMRQAGCWPLGPSTGTPRMWPAPSGGRGLRLRANPEAGAANLARVLEMHEAFHAFDGTLESIDMRHWAPDFMYWAAGNIGASRGVDGFRAHHQIPFLRAFPDREGLGHFVRAGCGPFAVTGGDVGLTHTGADYMGVAATGRRLRFRVMDFYRFEKGLIAENWLPNDTVGLLEQMGVDVMARMRHLTGEPRRTL